MSSIVVPRMTRSFAAGSSPRSIACALLRSEKFLALLDPGPSSTLPELRERLRQLGISISDLDAVLLTHIHLDHAGSTGTLVRENPNLKIYVHAKGVPHLLDPTKLLQSGAMSITQSIA